MMEATNKKCSVPGHATGASDGLEGGRNEVLRVWRMQGAMHFPNSDTMVKNIVKTEAWSGGNMEIFES